MNGRSWTAHYFERPAHAFLLEKSRTDRRTEPLLHLRRLKSGDFYDLAFKLFDHLVGADEQTSLLVCACAASAAQLARTMSAARQVPLLQVNCTLAPQPATTAWRKCSRRLSRGEMSSRVGRIIARAAGKSE